MIGLRFMTAYATETKIILGSASAVRQE